MDAGPGPSFSVHDDVGRGRRDKISVCSVFLGGRGRGRGRIFNIFRIPAGEEASRNAVALQFVGDRVGCSVVSHAGDEEGAHSAEAGRGGEGIGAVPAALHLLRFFIEIFFF